jgi:hypothetical protein
MTGEESRRLERGDTLRRLRRVLLLGGCFLATCAAAVIVISRTEHRPLVIGIEDGVGVLLISGLTFVVASRLIRTHANVAVSVSTQWESSWVSPARVAIVAATIHSFSIIALMASAAPSVADTESFMRPLTLTLIDRPLSFLYSTSFRASPVLGPRSAATLLLFGGLIYFGIAYVGTYVPQCHYRFSRAFSLRSLMVFVACCAGALGTWRLATDNEDSLAFGVAWHMLLTPLAIACGMAMVRATNAPRSFHVAIAYGAFLVIVGGNCGSLICAALWSVALHASPGAGVIAALIGGFLGALFVAAFLGVSGVVVARVLAPVSPPP